jgi:hypothetical protein
MDADNVTFPAVDPEAKPSHLFCMGLEFIRIDIHEAALDEIDSLRNELEYVHLVLKYGFDHGVFDFSILKKRMT